SPDRRSHLVESHEGPERRRAPARRRARGRASGDRRHPLAAAADRRPQRRRARGRDRSAGSHRRPGGPTSAAAGTAVARPESPPRRRRGAGAGSMMPALNLLAVALAAVAGAISSPHPLSPSPFGRGGTRGTGGTGGGADSVRVATLLAALAHTDPLICDMIGDQLGNFWMGGEPGRLGRFDDTPNVQGAKDSLAGKITDPRAVSLLIATLGTDNPCVRRVAAKLLGSSAVSASVLGSLLEHASPRIRESAAYAAGVGERRETRAALERRLTDTATGPAAMAAWALGQIQDPASAAALQASVHAASARVRLASAWALGQLEDASYAKDVLPLLRDTDPIMRATAAEALGR